MSKVVILSMWQLLQSNQAASAESEVENMVVAEALSFIAIAPIYPIHIHF